MAASAAPVPYIVLELDAVEENVGAARRAVADFAAEHGAAPETIARIRLAVSEAVTNAVVHAFPAPGGVVQVAADAEDGDLEVLVTDDGLGFRAGASPGQGLGLAVIQRCCDDFLIRDQLPHGVEVWMRFALA